MRNPECRANRIKARSRQAFSCPVCPCQSVYCSQAASRADISSCVNGIVGASLTLGRFSLSARFSLHQPRSTKKRPTARRRSSFFPPEIAPSFHCPRNRLSSGSVIWVVNWRPASAQNCESDGECFSRFSGLRWLMSRTRYFFRLASESRCASTSARNGGACLRDRHPGRDLLLDTPRDLPIASDFFGARPVAKIEGLIHTNAAQVSVHPNRTAAIVVLTVSVRALTGPESAGLHVAAI